MERLYDNLDNYEDENIVAELRRENGELKYKLEEYSVAMDKLQKDFDKLSSEFKKLEMNYSSLLKTAKEEIERKTQIINNLNIEKDMMVLKAIQNKNVQNLRRSGRKTPLSRSCDRNNDVNKTKTLNIEEGKTGEKTNNERNKITHMSSEETMTSTSNDIVTQCATKTVDRLRNTYQDVKENSESNVGRPMSISNRRKSMPAIRSEVRFSSDEDEDSYCTAGNKYQKINHNMKPQSMLKNLHNKNRLLGDRHRTSETSSMDDKYSNYRESCNNYRTRNSRFDSYRNRDKFDSQRSKRHGSPERLRRSARNFSNEQNTREEFNRHRLLVSPPPERYQSNQRRSRDGRSRYEDKEYFHKEKNRDRSQDNYSGKHKLQHDEEPLCKRRRNDSTHIREEEQGWDPDRGSIQISASVENISHMYCQSPDYSGIQDTAAINPKEIRNTAVTPLEDPRLQNKKNVSHLGDGGRSIELKVIDTSTWDIERVEMPKALTRRPSQSSEDIAHNIYSDIDNPISNMSLESGEIQTDDLEIFRTDQTLLCKVYDHSQDTKSIAPSKYSVVHVEKQPIEDFSHYRIPKFRKGPEKQPTEDNRSYTIKQLVKEPKDMYPLNNNKPNADTKQIENKMSQEICSANIPKHQSDPAIFNNVQSKKELTEKNNSNNELQRVELDAKKFRQEHLKQVNKAMVEGDLELSDETNDNIDVSKKFTPDNKITTCKEVSKSNPADCSPIETHKDSKANSDVSIKENAIDVSKKFTPDNKITTCKEVSKSNPTDCSPIETQKDSKANFDVSIKENAKSSKSKRKNQKASNKESTKKEKAEVIVEKRTRTKKDKKEAKEIKEKFSELFGDTTSSLITPEDLGIPPPQVESQSSDKYIPICEDAQDVVLMKPVETENSTTSLPTLISCDTNNKSVENIESEKLDEGNNIQINDTKKKKCKKNEVEKTVSTNIDENYSKPAHGSLPEDHARTLDTLKKDQTDVEKLVVTKTVENVLPLKADLLKALATSTPYKEIKEIPVAIDTPSPNTNCTNNFKHDIVVSIDDTPTDQSNNETLDSQTEVDAPDVRIFVRRRRKVVRKSKP